MHIANGKFLLEQQTLKKTKQELKDQKIIYNHIKSE